MLLTKMTLYLISPYLVQCLVASFFSSELYNKDMQTNDQPSMQTGEMILIFSF